MNNGFGAFLEKMREASGLWRMVFFAGLAVLVVLNFFIHPHHPHFGIDAYPGFWAGFGLLIGLAMVIIMKKVIQPMIARKEDYYDRNN